MNSHPNATVSGLSAALGTIVVAALDYYGYELEPAVAAAVVGATSAIVLAIGRDGVRGIVRRVWRGGAA